MGTLMSIVTQMMIVNEVEIRSETHKRGDDSLGEEAASAAYLRLASDFSFSLRGEDGKLT